jgi:hypothetical protein
MRHKGLHELLNTSVIDMERLHDLIDLMTPQDAGRVRGALEKAVIKDQAGMLASMTQEGDRRGDM